MNAISTAPLTVSGSVLAEKAVLAHPVISQWSARRYDRKATDAATSATGAAADAGRFNKSLLNRDALADIAQIAGAARDYHYERTLPWLDNGARILPAPLYLTYAERMRGFRAEFDAAVATFAAHYPAFVAAAQSRLGTLFNPADYPDASEIRRRFAFDLAIFPIPSGEDFRLSVPDTIRQDVERRVATALSDAIGDAGKRVLETIGRMADRLTEYKPATGAAKAEGVFRDSLVENVRDLANVLPAFNLTNDPRFAELVERVRRDLCRHDADALRQSDSLRREVAAAAAAIVSDMSDFLA